MRVSERESTHSAHSSSKRQRAWRTRVSAHYTQARSAPFDARCSMAGCGLLAAGSCGSYGGVVVERVGAPAAAQHRRAPYCPQPPRRPRGAPLGPSARHGPPVAASAPAQPQAPYHQPAREPRTRAVAACEPTAQQQQSTLAASGLAPSLSVSARWPAARSVFHRPENTSAPAPAPAPLEAVSRLGRFLIWQGAPAPRATQAEYVLYLCCSPNPEVSPSSEKGSRISRVRGRVRVASAVCEQCAQEKIKKTLCALRLA